MSYSEPLTLVTLDEVDSTNALLKRDIRLYENRLPCFLLAASQTRGRGRDERVWDSPVGGFYGTLAQKLKVSPSLSCGLLSLLAGLGLREVMADLLPQERLDLKWPNDLLCRERKLAGVLVENLVKGSEWLSFWGIGINLSRQQTPFPAAIQTRAISLCDMGVEPPDRVILAQRLYARFCHWLRLWYAGEGDLISSALAEASRAFNQNPIAVHDRGVRISGIFEGIDAQGALRLRMDSGELRICYGGEIEISYEGSGIRD
jgi:BirA family biotin operon repressor/biotin-[acetyl-CoA-carboxylase] ligase